jgi:hypothetical protein
MIVRSLCNYFISLCYNVISYVIYQTIYPIPGQSLSAGGVAEHHYYPSTSATCLLVSRTVWQSHLMIHAVLLFQIENRFLFTEFVLYA